jgi:hypothetical protein
VIGAVRGGTTWIHGYLATRGDVALPMGRKETYFFGVEYSRGLAWYAKQFAVAPTKQRVVEVCPTYLADAETPRRVLHDLGFVDLICSLRDPALRAFSHYLMKRRYGLTDLGFREAVAEHPVLLNASRYATHLRRWIELFGKKKLLVVFQEDLAADPNEYARGLCRHLNLPFSELPAAMLRPANQNNSLPRFNSLARVGYRAARLARSLGHHKIVALAKRAGLRKFFFGRPNPDALPRLTADDARWFMAQLGDEMDDLRELLGIRVLPWDDGQRERLAA